MFFKQIHRLFSFRRLFLLVAGLALTIQVIVISYNHFSGYYELTGWSHFFLRLFRGTLLSIFGGFLVAYPDLYVISGMNRKYQWGRRTLERIFIQFFSSLVIAITVSVIITMLAHWIRPYREELTGVLINNALIYAVVNVLYMVILEAWIFFLDSKRSREVAENLRQELTQIKFEVLKSQINPHFMFNSLNVLSGLINKDVKKAQVFIDEFSQVYRYVLETIEKPVSSLNKELDFMRSYLFLQQIRYGEDLYYSVDINCGSLNKVLPPLSLQVVLENAIKHNIVNKAKPLHISIYEENEFLVVRNSLQPKISAPASTGLGIKNLVKRYGMITDISPVFSLDASFYYARLPLISTDSDESGILNE